MSTATWRERISSQLVRERATLMKQGVSGDALEAALRESTRPSRTTGYLYQIWCQEVNVLFHPDRVKTLRGKKAAREQALLDEWNAGKPIVGGVSDDDLFHLG